jgi:hypothetical protein
MIRKSVERFSLATSAHPVAPSGAFVATNYSSHITDNIPRVGVSYRLSGQ